MIAAAKATHIRMAPRKIRYVLDLVRQKQVPQAFAILDNVPQRGAIVVKKLLQSAVASAKKQKQKEPEVLYISRTFADGAGMMKRFRAMTMGRAGLIRKRLSHVTLELDERIVAGRQLPVEGAKGAASQAKAENKKKKLAGVGR